MMNETAKLIGESFTTDDIGQKVAVETEKTVFCKVVSVSASEWFDAGRAGLKAEYRLTIRSDEYNGEVLAEYNGKRYGIYRTYRSGRDSIELYLEQKGGV